MKSSYSIFADVVSARLNKEGLFLECTSRSNYLVIGDTLTHKDLHFEVIEEYLKSKNSYESTSYTLFCNHASVYNEPVHKWSCRTLALMG